jgi:alpha-amylase
VFNHLIAADNLLQEAVGRTNPWVEATVDDYNFDSRQEVRLVNDKLVGLVAPAAGGVLYELDVRSICLNLLATLDRRPEAYHRKVLRGGQADHQGGHVASIHDRIVFKQTGLDQRVQYDGYSRKSLVDHFYDEDTQHAAVVRGEAVDLGDFVGGVFETRLRRNPDRIQVLMSRRGSVAGHPIKLTKGITLTAGESALDIAYLLEDLPPDRSFLFGVELNFAGLPAAADDRYFYQGARTHRLGHLGTPLDYRGAQQLGLVDEWLGIELDWRTNQLAGIWTFPIESVSQSEGGFELIHQSVVVQPYWRVQGDPHGRWSVTMRLVIDTSMAESRRSAAANAGEQVAVAESYLVPETAVPGRPSGFGEPMTAE